MEQCIQIVLLPKKKSAKKFLKEVKSSIAMHNTSTQFADGGEFGFGVKWEFQQYTSTTRPCWFKSVSFIQISSYKQR